MQSSQWVAGDESEVNTLNKKQDIAICEEKVKNGGLKNGPASLERSLSRWRML